METRLIPLPAKDGTVRAHALVDAADYDAIGHLRWYLNPAGYVVRKDGPRNVRLHRVLLGLTAGDSLKGDHINGDRLDNRRRNLRVATHEENEHNRVGLNKNNKSGHRGVYWSAKEQKWKVQVTLRRKVHSLGTFTDLADAVRVVETFRAEHMPFSRDARASNVDELRDWLLSDSLDWDAVERARDEGWR